MKPLLASLHSNALRELREKQATELTSKVISRLEATLRSGDQLKVFSPSSSEGFSQALDYLSSLSKTVRLLTDPEKGSAGTSPALSAGSLNLHVLAGWQAEGQKTP